MKIDPHFAEEFASMEPRPSRTYSMIASAVVRAVLQLNNIAKVAVYCWWLALGALVGHFFPAAMYWLMGISAVASFFILGVLLILWLANAADWSEHDDGYPGS